MKRWTTSFLLVALACTFGLLGGGIVMYLRQADASRNSAGTYSLATSPVTTLQTISTSLWNNTFADLATGVTDSLDRNGRGGMLAALRGIDGTVAAPALSFTSETGTGYYRIGSSDLGLSINGAKTGEWTVNGLRVANGAIATPSLSFFNDTGSGLYRAGSADLRFAVGGADKTFWNATGFGVGGAPTANLLEVIGASEPGFAVQNTAMTGSPSAYFGMNNGNTSGLLQILKASGTPSLPWKFYTLNSGSATLGLTIPAAGGITTAGVATLTGTIIGNGGSTITAWSRGGCTLNGASPSTCTLTVVAGQTCTASFSGTTAPPASGLRTNNSAGTVTVTGVNGLTDGVNITCF